jgi:hypothetical protein
VNPRRAPALLGLLATVLVGAGVAILVRAAAAQDDPPPVSQDIVRALRTHGITVRPDASATAAHLDDARTLAARYERGRGHVVGVPLCVVRGPRFGGEPQRWVVVVDGVRQQAFGPGGGWSRGTAATFVAPAGLRWTAAYAF